MRAWNCRTVDDTRAVGALLARELAPDGVLLLEGELGSGKTVLVQGLAAALGLDPGHVQSPTFTLIREHNGTDSRLVHVDLYRLESDEAEAIGLEELLAGAGVKAVEWAERLTIPVESYLRLRIERTESGLRRICEL